MEEIKGDSLLFCGDGNSGTFRMVKEGVLRRLESISAYSSAYEMLENEAVLPQNEGFLHFLLHVDDWEHYKYFCLNGEIAVLCDSINGDVLSFDTVDSFMAKTMQFYLEDDDD